MTMSLSEAALKKISEKEVINLPWNIKLNLIQLLAGIRNELRELKIE